MVTLVCAIVGAEGSAFPVDIEASRLVGHLKDAIKKENSVTITCDAKDLQLFLAKKDGAWLPSRTEDVKKLKKGEKTPLIESLTSEDLELQGEDPIAEFLADMKTPKAKQIHVLVVVSKPVGEDGAWSAKDLSTVDPQLQSKMWKSVVRVSSEDVCSGTALVVDRTPTHLYLLTNLHLWVDATFTRHLSAAFKKDIKRYLRLYPQTKTSGRKRKDPDVAMQPRRNPPRTSAKKTRVISDKPQVVVEQLLPGNTKVEKVDQFSLDSGSCWRSSADFDFAIFEVAVPRDVELVQCTTSLKVFDTMSVDVFGFPGALQDQKFGHSYAIIPAKVTGWSGNQMTLSALSAPGLSGSAIVCTKRGVPVGYIGGGFDGSKHNEQYQSYGFTFHGMPLDLPSSLPPVTEDETKD